ncbi:PAS domain S-box protein [Alkalihalobacillus sp. 1P02AB]|uniref:PAS domain S-box protein n=1 Tax=Alkalihalobacillus sp. 1P02AB TaxID=3132260 RepID=UPI0039A52F89
MTYKRKMLLIYISIGILWIVITDYLVFYLDMDTYISIQKIKGVVFVLLTGIFIYHILGKREQLQLLKNEKERLSTLINSMVDFVNFKDGEGRWIDTNQYGLKLFQLEGVDYRGKTDAELAKYTDFYHDALLACIDSDEETWRSGQITRVEEMIPQPDGSFRTFETIKVPLFEANQKRKGLVVIGRDVTERIIANKQVKDSEIKYKSLFKYNPELVFMVDLNGYITELNPQFEPLTGFEPNEAIGKSINDYIDEKDRERIEHSLANVRTEKMTDQNSEILLKHKGGQKVIVHCVFVPILNGDEIQGIIGYTTDMTSALATEEKLRTTEKLAVVGELAAGIAHEIRNPLTSLKGFVQLFQIESKEKNFIHDVMLDELERINTIVSELLVLARPQELIFCKKNLNDIMDNVLTLLHSEMNLHGVTVSLDQKAEELLLDCEPNQLKQLFLNILKNSMEASATHIQIEIFKEGAYLGISVKDNGCGIEKERLKKIGEPFYSQKEKGTGLGLTVSFKIVEAHRGTIHYDSIVNEGTIVTMKFPVNRM